MLGIYVSGLLYSTLVRTSQNFCAQGCLQNLKNCVVSYNRLGYNNCALTTQGIQNRNFD